MINNHRVQLAELANALKHDWQDIADKYSGQQMQTEKWHLRYRKAITASAPIMMAWGAFQFVGYFRYPKKTRRRNEAHPFRNKSYPTCRNRS